MPVTLTVWLFGREVFAISLGDPGGDEVSRSVVSADLSFGPGGDSLTDRHAVEEEE